ncbi:hypothetical protein OTSANNIE_0964 [Anaplasma phagocytophilum str. Annie]|nr:hypothetical protein OTSANNIE_0964 [Anaplasma phagocytophilum str. Annie]
MYEERRSGCCVIVLHHPVMHLRKKYVNVTRKLERKDRALEGAV